MIIVPGWTVHEMSVKQKGRAKPRSERSYPQLARVVSTKFLAGFNQVDQKCFVPLDDYRKLERKYRWMLKRYINKPWMNG